MGTFLSKFNGYKTYILAAAGVIFTAAQLWNGAIDQNTAIDAILGFLGLGTMRHGISTGAKP